MRKLLLLAFGGVLLATGANAQVIVNPDGTHSVIHGNTLVNPDGTHSTVHRKGTVLPVGSGMSAGQGGVFLDGRRISATEARNYLRLFPEATKHFRRGRFVYAVSNVAAVVGGTMVGYEIGRAITGQGVNAVGLTAGVLVCGGAIGLTFVTVRQYKKAATAYNSASGLAQLPHRDITLAVAPTPGGIGLRLTF